MTKKSTGGYNMRQKRLNPFSVDIYSEIDEKQYSGKFVSKKLGIRDLAALGVRKAQLNGGMHHDAAHPGSGVDADTDEFNSMLAHLELALVEWPEWWDLDEISDVQIFVKVFQEVMSFENTFLGRRGRASSDDGDESGGGGEGSGSSDASGSVAPGDAATVVDEEVQSALEP